MTRLCPSAQPGMDRCTVLGVLQHDKPVPMLLYMREPVPATPAILAMAAPLNPTEVFRLAATCAEQKCSHFDGLKCRLADRIVRLMPAAVDRLPPCSIRQECRWFVQEGGAACQRCPAVTTITYDLSDQSRAISGLPVFQDTW